MQSLRKRSNTLLVHGLVLGENNAMMHTVMRRKKKFNRGRQKDRRSMLPQRIRYPDEYPKQANQTLGHSNNGCSCYRQPGTHSTWRTQYAHSVSAITVISTLSAETLTNHNAPLNHGPPLEQKSTLVGEKYLLSAQPNVHAAATTPSNHRMSTTPSSQPPADNRYTALIMISDQEPNVCMLLPPPSQCPLLPYPRPPPNVMRTPQRDRTSTVYRCQRLPVMLLFLGCTATNEVEYDGAHPHDGHVYRPHHTTIYGGPCGRTQHPNDAQHNACRSPLPRVASRSQHEHAEHASDTKSCHRRREFTDSTFLDSLLLAGGYRAYARGSSGLSRARTRCGPEVLVATHRAAPGLDSGEEAHNRTREQT